LVARGFATIGTMKYLCDKITESSLHYSDGYRLAKRCSIAT
jgi:hypothetical protein